MKADNTSIHTLVAVYDNIADGEAAIQALVAAGFERDSVRMNPKAEESGTTSRELTSDADDVHTGIRGFFYSLFGGDDYKEHRDVYQETVRRGSYVVLVDVEDESKVHRATEVLERFGPVDIDERVGHWRQQGWTAHDEGAPRYSTDEAEKERSSYAQMGANRPADTTGVSGTAQTQRIPVIEEELAVGKRQVQRGGIRVFQRVREIPVHESVELREEHVKVERRPVNQPATQADLAFKEGSVELRETAEEAVTSKRARVVEEVVIGKEVSQRTEQINDTVRRTDVEVEQLGAGTSPDDAEFRNHWQSTYGSSGGRYEDYDSAYRYGYTAAGSGRYKNYQWNDVEPQLRSDWESNHPGNTWDKVKDAVRYGAERVTGKHRQ